MRATLLVPFCCVVLLLSVAGVACGGDGGPDGPGAEPDPEPPAGYGGGPGGFVSVEEARRAGGRKRVRGTVIASGGEVRLCSAILESFPPQCGEPSLVVEGLDLDSVVGTTTMEGVTWSEREVTLEGDVGGDVLRVRD